MKIVLDTNVLVSGIFFTGPPYRILDAWRRGTVQIVLSGEILDEYNRVLDELSSKFEGIDVHPVLELLLKASEIVEGEALARPVFDDPDDDKFIAAALSGGVDIIISGDKHLLKISGYSGITVFRPRAFVERYLKSPSGRAFAKRRL